MAPTSKPKGGFDKSSLTGSFMGSIIIEVCEEAGQGLQGFWVESLRATWLLRTSVFHTPDPTPEPQNLNPEIKSVP